MGLSAAAPAAAAPLDPIASVEDALADAEVVEAPRAPHSYQTIVEHDEQAEIARYRADYIAHREGRGARPLRASYGLGPETVAEIRASVDQSVAPAPVVWVIALVDQDGERYVLALDGALTANVALAKAIDIATERLGNRNFVIDADAADGGYCKVPVGGIAGFSIKE